MNGPRNFAVTAVQGADKRIAGENPKFRDSRRAAMPVALPSSAAGCPKSIVLLCGLSWPWALAQDLFFREGWEYILEKHGGRLPVKIKAGLG